jgi:hypothetical protein
MVQFLEILSKKRPAAARAAAISRDALPSGSCNL